MNEKNKLKSFILQLLILFTFVSIPTNTIVFAVDAVKEEINTEYNKNDKTNTIDNFNKKLEPTILILSSTVDMISSSLLAVAIAFSVVSIAKIGFSIMQKSSSSIDAINLAKEEFKDKLSVLIFILIIPSLVTGIKTLTLPSEVGLYIDSSYNNSTLTELNTVPNTTFLTSFYKDRLNAVEKVELEKNKENEEDIELLDDNSSGVQKKINVFIRSLVVNSVYNSAKNITYSITNLGYFPMTFNQNFYNYNTYDEVIRAATNSDTAVESTKVVRTQLGTFNFIILMVYGLLYRIFFIFIEVICYLKSIKILVGKNEEDTTAFIKRLFTTVILFIMFPLILEFLLNLDIVISTSVSSLLGNISSSSAILSIIPDSELAKTSFVVIAFGLIAIAIIFILSLLFFSRRIFITITFIASPILFLQYLYNPKNPALESFMKKFLNMIFLNIILSPIMIMTSMFIMLMGKNLLSALITIIFVTATIIYGIKLAKELTSQSPQS